MTITLDLPVELEKLLQIAAQTQGKDVAAFLLDSARLRLRHDVLSESETQLLLQLQSLFPSAETYEYYTLCDKSDTESISDMERQRLITLTEQRDLQNAKRLEILGDLAQLRGVSLRDIMRQLQIQPD